MLKEKLLYKIQKMVNSDTDKVRITINLNPAHPIFEGHFPKNPVMPGVASVQIAGEVLSEWLKKKYILTESGNMKFLAVIQPQTDSEIDYEIKYEILHDNKLKANVVIESNEKTFVKFNAIYKESERK